LKDKLSGMSSGPGLPITFPFSDHPNLPPKVSDIELWQFYLREKFSLRKEDIPFLIPIRDSGKSNASEDYKLFSDEEETFWNQQLFYVISTYKAHLQAMNEQKPLPPINITYNVTGSNARININTIDSSVNIINTEVAELFNQLRECLNKIVDDIAWENIRNSIDAMESAHGSNDFVARYKEFISLVADHMTIFAPLLPLLSNLLT
jgi:hypothetical protein